VLRTTTSVRQEGRRPCWNDFGWWRCSNSHLLLRWCRFDHCIRYLGRQQLVNWSGVLDAERQQDRSEASSKHPRGHDHIVGAAASFILHGGLRGQNRWCRTLQESHNTRIANGDMLVGRTSSSTFEWIIPLSSLLFTVHFLWYHSCVELTIMRDACGMLSCGKL